MASHVGSYYPSSHDNHFAETARPAIFTFDADFRIYRRHGNKVIPVLMPDGG